MIDTAALDCLYDLALYGDNPPLAEPAAGRSVEAANAYYAVRAQLTRAIETPSINQVANVGLPLLAANAVLGAAIGSSARRLQASAEDIVVVWTPGSINALARQRLADSVRAAFEATGLCVTIFALPDGIAIEALDREQMRSLGWVRTEAGA